MIILLEIFLYNFQFQQLRGAHNTEKKSFFPTHPCSMHILRYIYCKYMHTQRYHPHSIFQSNIFVQKKNPCRLLHYHLALYALLLQLVVLCRVVPFFHMNTKQPKKKLKRKKNQRRRKRMCEKKGFVSFSSSSTSFF